MIARLLVLLALVAFAAPAEAHRKRSVRKAMATVRAVDAGRALDVMVWLRVAGPRAEQLRARFDLNRSRTFEPPEAALVGDALSAEAIGGLVTRVDGTARAPKSAEARARITDDGAVEVAILLAYAPGELGAVELAVRAERERPGTPAMVAEVSVLPPLRILRASKEVKGAVVGPMALVGSATLDVQVIRPKPAEAKP